MQNDRELGLLQHFLLSRIAEQVQEHAHMPSLSVVLPEVGAGCIVCDVSEYGSCGVQRDADAKTRFIRQCDPFVEGADADSLTASNQQGARSVYLQGLRLMANSYFDHPDYEKEWAI